MRFALQPDPPPPARRFLLPFPISVVDFRVSRHLPTRFSLTLLHSLRNKSFACHSYGKTPGVGTQRSFPFWHPSHRSHGSFLAVIPTEAAPLFPACVPRTRARPELVEGAAKLACRRQGRDPGVLPASWQGHWDSVHSGS